MNLNIFLAQIWKTFSFEVYNIYFKNNNYVVGVDEEEYFVIEYDQYWNIVDTIYRSGEPDKLFLNKFILLMIYLNLLLKHLKIIIKLFILMMKLNQLLLMI